MKVSLEDLNLDDLRYDESWEDRDAEEEIKQLFGRKGFHVYRTKAGFSVDWLFVNPEDQSKVFVEFKRRSESYENIASMGGFCMTIDKYATAVSYCKSINVPLMFIWLCTDCLVTYVTCTFPAHPFLFMKDRKNIKRISPCLQIPIDLCDIW